MVSGTAALLLDPLSGGRGARNPRPVRTVLGADVTAVAYSHAHRDHAGDAAELVSTAREEVAVLAARDCAARLPRLRGRSRPSSGTLPMPPNRDEPPRGLELYRGSRPIRTVNAASDQLQLDIYGEALDSIFFDDQRGLPVGHRGWTSICELLDWLAAHWDQPEEGIWETRGGARTSPTAS